MTTTTTSPDRFTLIEREAPAWIAANGYPDSYSPAKDDDEGDVTFEIVNDALDAGIITDTLDSDGDGLAFEYVPDGDGGGYRWILHHDKAANFVTCSRLYQMSQIGDGYDSKGDDATMAVLREAVREGNALARRLAEYVAALPLEVRAPELSEVWAAHLSHRHGDDFTVHTTYESARGWIVDYAREWWREMDHEAYGLPESCDGLSDDEVVEHYFEHNDDESWNLDPCPIITG